MRGLKVAGGWMRAALQHERVDSGWWVAVFGCACLQGGMARQLRISTLIGQMVTVWVVHPSAGHVIDKLFSVSYFTCIRSSTHPCAASRDSTSAHTQQQSCVLRPARVISGSVTFICIHMHSPCIVH
eukprot:364952-Chlamydomonas_euryale.AAC.8